MSEGLASGELAEGSGESSDLRERSKGHPAVLLLREVEGMTTAQVAEILGVEPDVVKTRLHRARRALRGAIENRVGEEMKSAYSFGNERCDRVVAAVLSRLAPRE